jgi:hypothetical protein
VWIHLASSFVEVTGSGLLPDRKNRVCVGHQGHPVGELMSVARLRVAQMLQRNRVSKQEFLVNFFANLDLGTLAIRDLQKAGMLF